MLKNFLCSIFILYGFCTNAQLISSSSSTKSNSFDTSSTIYIGFGYLNTFRDLAPNTSHLNTPLGERANEISRWLPNYSLRIGVPVLRVFKIIGGIEFQQNGESYNWNSTESDSSFAYQTSYRYISMPVHISIGYGNKLRVYGSAGISPGIFSSYVQKQQWQDKDGSDFTDENRVQNDCNSFVISLQADFGIHYSINSNFGIQMTAHYRKQLNSTFKEFEDYIHKAYALGLNTSITYRL